ncbi:MAG: tRNA (N6-threonylcarbamoyladenosine(37)-N6)-methyltransferase TrmO [Promethearchaeota archaeon]
MTIKIKQIGVIYTPFKSSEGVPIQSTKSDAIGEALLNEEYARGLDSLDGFSHIILLYWCHKANPPSMMVKPYLDTKEHGIFSTRAPSRPNPIGLSIVELIQVEETGLRFKGADMLDGTPLLDIKPFVPEFDNRISATSGWLSRSLKKQSQSFISDDRFEKGS